MPSEPFILIFPIEDFDLGKLPIDPELLKSDRRMLEQAVSDAYVQMFEGFGGEVSISISNGIVTVRWQPSSDVADIVERVGELLSKGDYKTAVPILRGLLGKHPSEPAVLYNLGMALSDMGELDDATRLLQRLVALQPRHARALTALGVAHARAGRTAEAIAALRKSLELDPDEGYSHRNLGGLLAKTAPAEALPHFKRAAELLPDDQASQYGYGLALFQSGKLDEADSILKQAVEMNPLTPAAEQARSVRTQIAHKNMRANAGGGLRMDVVLYCVAALRLFKEQPDKLQPVTFEIAMLGRRGLDINNSEEKYTLTSLPGRFSGMQLVSYMYVGLSSLAPGQDQGIDLAKEYQEALKLFGAGM